MTSGYVMSQPVIHKYLYRAICVHTLGANYSTQAIYAHWTESGVSQSQDVQRLSLPHPTILAFAADSHQYREHAVEACLVTTVHPLQQDSSLQMCRL